MKRQQDFNEPIWSRDLQTFLQSLITSAALLAKSDDEILRAKAQGLGTGVRAIADQFRIPLEDVTVTTGKADR